DLRRRRRNVRRAGSLPRAAHGVERYRAVACVTTGSVNLAEPPARIGLPCGLCGADARAHREEGVLMAGTGSCCAAGRAGVEGDSADARAGTHRDVAADPLLRAVAAPAAEVRARGELTVLVEAGPFRMGTEDADRNPGDGESPVRTVDVPAFRIDAACVTGAEFAAFVAETGYVTEAEEFGWSFVFGALLRSEEHTSELQSPFDLVC